MPADNRRANDVILESEKMRGGEMPEESIELNNGRIVSCQEAAGMIVACFEPGTAASAAQAALSYFNAVNERLTNVELNTNEIQGALSVLHDPKHQSLAYLYSCFNEILRATDPNDHALATSILTNIEAAAEPHQRPAATNDLAENFRQLHRKINTKAAPDNSPQNQFASQPPQPFANSSESLGDYCLKNPQVPNQTNGRGHQPTSSR